MHYTLSIKNSFTYKSNIMKFIYSFPKERLHWSLHSFNLMTVSNAFLQKGSVSDGTEPKGDTAAETVVSPVDTQKAEETKKIIDSQYKCFEKMNRDPPYNKSGRGGLLLFEGL